ncbi:unnamed protein product, partial [Callosobruchus maculatus]
RQLEWRYNYWRKQNIDDTTLIAASQEELVALLNILEQHCSVWSWY